MWQDIALCHAISGDREIYNSEATRLVAPYLTYAAGLLYISSNPDLLAVNLTSLGAVNGFLSLDENNALTLISLPALTTVNGYLDVYDNPGLLTLDLPLLSVLNGDLRVRRNVELSLFNVPILTLIDGIIYICENKSGFVLPSGPPYVPAGGLVVTGALKNTPSCQLDPTSCSTMTVCP
jgi:hypothetical protein